MAPRLVLAATCLLLAGAAAGCGSSSSSSSSNPSTSASSNPTPVQTVTQTGSGPDHFTPAQWAAYQSTAGTFTTLNKSTLAKVAACSKPVGVHNVAPAVLRNCVGTSLVTLFDATVKLGRTLAGMAGTVSGDCGGALNDLIGYVVPYEASLKALQSLIKTGNTAGAPASVASIETARSGGQEQAAAVAKSCAP